MAAARHFLLPPGPHISATDKAPAPLWSAALYLPALAAAIRALSDRNFSPTPDRLAGLGRIALLMWPMYARFGGRYVRPVWKLRGKVVATLIPTWLAMVWRGPRGLLLPVLHQFSGFVGHVLICRRHGIGWRTVDPRDRDIALQGKWARGDFS